MNQKLGRFELIEQIDAGGHTTVYRAVEDMGQGITRPAAVKVMQSMNLDDEEQLARLRREVEVLVDLGGAPNIVSILAMGIDEKHGAWIAMELAGKSLVHSVTDEPAEPDRVRVLLRDTLSALVCVHGAQPQILHRDLKPQNILRAQGVWKVSDFGLAKRRGAEETMNLATVKYAAPELLDATLGEESPRMDLYSLGMVAYELALGRELFQKQFPSIYDPAAGRESEGDDRPKWMYWHTSQQMALTPISELVEGYPDDLSDLIAAMTVKPVTRRIDSAEEALRRLGEVGAAAPRADQEQDEDEDQGRTVSPVIAAVAAVAMLVAMVGGLMWYLLEGRPNIELDSGGEFRTNSETVQVTGLIENLPEAGRAEIQVRRGGLRTFPVAIDGRSRFTCDVRLRDVGSFQATMVLEDRADTRVARAQMTLVRVEPETVELELRTSPVVQGATVLVRGSGGDDPPVTLTTDSDGVVRAEVPYGEFAVEAFHPRYQPLPMKVVPTGIDPLWTGTMTLAELDQAALRAEMQREIDRLMRLMDRKTNCPPGPLSEAEEQQVLASMDRLRQLGDGDADIELFLEAIGQVEDCDPSTMVQPPPEEGKGDGADSAEAINRVIERLERLIDRKVNCPPGPLSEFEEQALDRALDELATLALGDIDVELYIDAVRRVEDCDPSSRPQDVPRKKTREERDRLAEQEGGDAGGGSFLTPAGPGKGIGDEVKDFLRDQGFGDVVDEGGGSGSGSDDEGESIIDDVLAKAPPNPELVERLMSMPLDEFADFVRSNVPSGAIAVEPLPDLDQVRIRGPLFRRAELERLTIRLAYGFERLQPELRVDPWGLCRRLAAELEGLGATGVLVDAYLAPQEPAVYVQFERREDFDPVKAEDLSSTYVLDQGLLRIQGYAAPPVVRDPGSE